MKPLDRLREHLARADALVPLVLVGALSGALTGLVITGFRWLSEVGPVSLGLLNHSEAFEGLEPAHRLVLPILGALLLGVLLRAAPESWRTVGVTHVMERLAYHSGRLPWPNALVQFFGAVVAIGTGHSVGREGPVIHVGAASSSLLGQALGLPNNSLRVLVACGVAAGIAASFDTPLAGVVFAMEVVMMEYTITGFTPVIMAAVVATSIARGLHGAEPAVSAPPMDMVSLWELPYMILLGVVVGTLAAAFVQAMQVVTRRAADLGLLWRFVLAGIVAGVCGALVPQVMGLGYDTLEAALLGEIGLALLVAITLTKLVATTACVGLGIPGGLIGPTLVIGATAGGALGLVGHALAPEQSATTALYAMLGMGAMMGATLQAPLAALMAMLELTASPRILMPGMLAIVTATLTSRVLFKQRSVFVTVLEVRGLDYHFDPVAVSLSRTGVGAVMERRFTTVERGADPAAVRQALDAGPEWILVVEGNRILGVVEPQRVAAGLEASGDDAGQSHGLDPDAIEGLRRGIVTVRLQATLGEALERLEAEGAEVVLVSRAAVALRNGVYGVLDRDRIEASVRYAG